MFRIIWTAAFCVAAGAVGAQTDSASAPERVADRAARETAADVRRGESDASPAAKSAPERKVRVIVPSPYASGGD